MRGKGGEEEEEGNRRRGRVRVTNLLSVKYFFERIWMQQKR
jgi:hypothetical protein